MYSLLLKNLKTLKQIYCNLKKKTTLYMLTPIYNTRANTLYDFNNQYFAISLN